MPPLPLLLLLASPAVYVSSHGSDTNPGTSNRPVATLDAALVRARAIHVHTVIVGAGTYRLDRSLRIGAEDRGLVLVAAKGVRPLISGGVEIPKSLLKPEPGSPVFSVDLSELGIGELPPVTGYGFPKPITPAPNTLYSGGQPMTLARWPNEGFAHIKSVREPGNGESDRDAPPRRPIFTADSDRPQKWAGEPDVWLYGYWRFDWADESIHMASADAATGEITLESPHTFGVDAGIPFFAENVRQELDTPGEYYIDRKGKKLELIPKGDAPLVFSKVGEPLISVERAENVSIQGLDFAYGRGDAVRIVDSEDVRILGCRLYDLGNRGVVIEGGKRCMIRSSDIWNTGEGGVSLSGGDRTTLTPAEHIVENCDIHHYQLRSQTYRPAVSISGVGMTVDFCAIHDAPHAAIIFSGNNHVISHNEFYRNLARTGDGGVVYTGRDWTARGTRIDGNYFHDNIGIRKWEPAIYLDDQASGITAEGNLIERCHWAFMVGGGRDNVLENNTIVDCALAFRNDARGLGWAAKGRPTMEERLRAVPYKSEVWRSSYPALVNILNEDPMAPRGNVLRNNHLIRSGKVLDQNEEPFIETAVYDGNTEDSKGVVKRPMAGLRPDALRKSLESAKSQPG